tara:strand:- start:926 stop:1195 length:270 start_codon:yes stop_codon:yes gene_type:complete
MSCENTKIRVNIKNSLRLFFSKVRKMKIKNQIIPINANDSVKTEFPNLSKGFKGRHIIINRKNVTRFEKLKTLDISFTKKSELRSHKKI